MMFFYETIFLFQKSNSQSSASSSSDLHSLQMGNNSTNMDCSCVQIAFPTNPLPAENPMVTPQQSTLATLPQRGSAHGPTSPGALESVLGTVGESPAQRCVVDRTAAESVPAHQDALSPILVGPDQDSTASALPPLPDQATSSANLLDLGLSS
jgi:hypothetical protein